MRAKRTHVVITESNKSEQPDSNHDKLFIDVSKQSDELFQYQGNTSSDDQYKNQQLDTETVSQQGYIVCRQQIWNRLFKLVCHQRYQHQLQCRNNIHSTTHFKLCYRLKIWYNQQYQIPIRCSSEENKNKLIIIPIVQ